MKPFLANSRFAGDIADVYGLPGMITLKGVPQTDVTIANVNYVNAVKNRSRAYKNNGYTRWVITI